MSLSIVPCSPPRNAGSLLPRSFCSVAGLTKIALSQVILVIGFGSSCSHPLFAKRPSRTHGSRRKATSSPVGTGDWGLGTGDWGLGTADWGLGTGDRGGDWKRTVIGAYAVSG